MDDALLVRVLYSLTDRHEEPESFERGQVVLIAVPCDGHATHEFHHEIRTAGFGRAGVEDFGNVRMVHQSQGLPFGFEASNYLPGIHSQLDDFERDAAFHWLLLFRYIDGAEAAFAELFEKFVAANDSPRAFRKRRHYGLRAFDGWVFHK